MTGVVCGNSAKAAFIDAEAVTAKRVTITKKATLSGGLLNSCGDKLPQRDFCITTLSMWGGSFSAQRCLFSNRSTSLFSSVSS